jgi:hypothetical protein
MYNDHTSCAHHDGARGAPGKCALARFSCAASQSRHSLGIADPTTGAKVGDVVKLTKQQFSSWSKKVRSGCKVQESHANTKSFVVCAHHFRLDDRADAGAVGNGVLYPCAPARHESPAQEKKTNQKARRGSRRRQNWLPVRQSRQGPERLD